ncbi:VOC family protein [Litorilituus sediminis]|uniref:VOC family protein n=1 Tax=Litorilituus sediminis TaxID=718192 RepID=A0A4P6P4L7_9GAMM|nr:VOC family protein [Litorilituus sediminis]QBG36491.1 VOC family protein [Litorilituus sediminis]
MNLSFHINFDGRCEEAFQFYQKNLDAVIGPLLTYKDSPASENVANEWQNKILHGSISIGNIDIAGTDTVINEYEKPAGFCLLLRLASEERVKSLFEIFKEGGEVILPPQKTFWSPCYAIVTDRFGVPWKFNCVI